MCKPGSIIVRDGVVGVTAGGRVAVCREDGTCPECCGGAVPSGPCVCYPVAHSGITCGAGGVGADIVRFEIRAFGTVTLREYAKNLTANIVQSDVAEATKTFDVTLLVSLGCDGQISTFGQPSSSPELVWTQGAPAGPQRKPAPYFQVSGALAANLDAASSGAGGWSVSVPARSTWGLQGPYTYSPPSENSIVLGNMSPSVNNFILSSGVCPIEDRVKANWTQTASEAHAEALVGGFATKSQADFESDYNTITCSQGSTLSHSRSGCTYSFTRTFSVEYQGERGASTIIEEDVAVSMDYTVQVRMVQCVEAIAMSRALRTADPMAVVAAERALRQCRGCGDGWVG